MAYKRKTYKKGGYVHSSNKTKMKTRTKSHILYKSKSKSKYKSKSIKNIVPINARFR